MNTSKDSRRDPRAKILSLTVRYKSATVAEFVENHSYDVSRGGMFIRTQAPFPNGTLIKFEVRIAEEQRVMTGVGRVTWRREKDAGEDNPAGMGVKFIKIDDDSVQVIDQLVKARASDTSSFEAGAKEQGIPLSDPPSNIRVTQDDRISSRPPPAGDMLDQSASLLKSAMGVLAATSQPPEELEQRATLPTGQSNPEQRALSLQDLAKISGPPSDAPAPGSAPSLQSAVVDSEVSATDPTTRARDSSSLQGVSLELSEADKVNSVPAAVEAAPASEPEAASDPGEPSSGPRSDKRAKANGKKRPKKEKKRKKKFRYASIPAPKQTLHAAVEASAAPLSLTSITTTPPRKRRTEPPPTEQPNRMVWVVLGAVVVVLGLFWVNRMRGSSERTELRTPAQALDGNPNKTPAPPAKPAAPPVNEVPTLRIEDLPREPVADRAEPTVSEEEDDQGTVTEEVDNPRVGGSVRGKSSAAASASGAPKKGKVSLGASSTIAASPNAPASPEVSAPTPESGQTSKAQTPEPQPGDKPSAEHAPAEQPKLAPPSTEQAPVEKPVNSVAPQTKPSEPAVEPKPAPTPSPTPKAVAPGSSG
ncbi:MAG TPA: TIGR02266 family protein [Polyangiaceae bacterium]|nr:TIGR02266 family protein [Polyangiaceae bacterium]